ncbi:two-component system regulatory protein YycI [Trichococcus paludicola]|uniref:two-component system regulatory protein YycI n=1 Tax=Trichococcus paludicola TaxID=2052942 RepID=UPI00131C080A|nr:two-component system regulatory protein YycI [Trichococcus paludicola]
MDFRRIKIIFILTFAALNIYLLSVLLEKNATTLSFGSESTTLNIEEAMKADDIAFPTLSTDQEKIPLLKTDKGGMLEAEQSKLVNQTTVFEDGVLSSVLSNPIPLEIDAEDLTIVDRTPIADFILQGNVLYGAEYTFLTYLPLRRQLVYAQVANNIPIGDSTGSITFNLDPDYEVISYEQTFAGVAEVQGSSRTVISQKRAVEALYLNNQIPSNSTVRMVQLTYYRTLSLSDMDIYSPMWYIEIKIENAPVEIRRVDALTGSIITTSTVSLPSAEAQIQAKTANKSALLMEEVDSSETENTLD